MIGLLKRWACALGFHDWEPLGEDYVCLRCGKIDASASLAEIDSFERQALAKGWRK